MKSKICPICKESFCKLMRHINLMHPELYQQECDKAISLFKNGLTLREIGEGNLTLFSFGSGLAELIRKNIPKAELSAERSRRISYKLSMGFEQGVYKLTGRGRKSKSDEIQSSINAHPTEVLKWHNQDLTKDFILSLPDSDIAKLKDALIIYIGRCDYTKPNYTEEDLMEDWANLKNNKCEYLNYGIIKNNTSVGSKIYKYFFPNILRVRSMGKMSVYRAINNKDVLKKILDNRLNKDILSKYSGSITKNMIIQGAKVSGNAFAASQFKPLVAKSIYNKYAKDYDNILDFSCGFGSRLLGAMATEKNLKYFGYEPCLETYQGLINMSNYFGFNTNIKKCGSETEIFVEKMNFIFSSPPYFNHEIYSNEETQCYNKYPSYKEWLEKYWRQTADNIKLMMAEGAIFAVNVGNDANEKMIQIAEDFCRINEECGFKMIDKIIMKTSLSPLAKQSESYKNEGIYVYRLKIA